MCHLMEAITSKIVSLSKDAVEIDDPETRNKAFEQIVLLGNLVCEGASRANAELKMKQAIKVSDGPSYPVYDESLAKRLIEQRAFFNPHAKPDTYIK